MKTLISLLFTFCFLLIGCTQKREPVRALVSNKPVQQVTASPSPPKSNVAIVISRHANLRDSDSASATVLQVVPQDASVEVVKQQGAWFYVKTETAQGWMHGNTLKLQNFEIAAPVAQRTPNPTPPPIVEETINNSGASAKCRDGSLSYSAHRRGTCSHHGGVAVWY